MDKQIYLIDKETLTNIAKAIRTKKGTDAKILTDDFATEILSIESGDLDAFWDDIHNTAETVGCSGLFYGPAWNDTWFKPKRMLKPFPWGHYMFKNSKIVDGAYTDLLDFSACRSIEGMAWGSTLRKLKVLDTRMVEPDYGYYQSFDSSLEYVEEFYPSTKFKGKSSDTFGYCTKLKHIKFCSELSYRGLRLRCNELDKESIESVMDNLSPTTENLTVTFQLAAINKAYETSEGANNGSTSEEWINKVMAHPNWTIVLA